MTRLALLLGYGAGIRWIDDKVVVEEEFWPFEPNKLNYVNELVDIIVDDILDSRLKFDYLATFEDRPATSALAQLVAVKLGTKQNRLIPTLVVSRKGRTLYFRYFIPGQNGSRGRVIHLKNLRDAQATQLLLEQRRVLVFASSIRNVHEDPTLRMLQIPRVLSKEVRIVGLAALAILSAKTRSHVRDIVGTRRFPIFFVHHFDRPDEPPSRHGHLASRFIRNALRRLLSRQSTKS